MTICNAKKEVDEKRKTERNVYSAAVVVTIQGHTEMEYIRDISAWGMFVRTEKPVAIGENITMTIPHPDGNQTIKIIGEVVRSNSDGIGVKFKMGIDGTFI
jgi:Tfp pilus assembly protein PilZ